MNTFTIIDSGTIDSETKHPCQWILTDQWELIFNTEYKIVEIKAADLTKLLNNSLWKKNVRSVSFKESVNFSDTPNFENLFHDWKSLISADLRHMDFECCTRLDCMFSGCSSLEWVLFPTSPFGDSVESMDFMFANCNHLHHADLTNLSPEFLYTMESAFSGCSELTFINLSNVHFGIDYEACMIATFRNCTHLRHCLLPSASLISDVDLRKCFSNCINLKSIDLSTFYYEDDIDTFDSYIKLENCFKNCTSLEHVRFPNLYPEDPVHFLLNETQNKNDQFSAPNIFSSCPHLLTFKTETKIPYEALKEMQLPIHALISYFKQFDNEDLSDYLENYLSDPSLKTELMNILSLINFE